MVKLNWVSCSVGCHGNKFIFFFVADFGLATPLNKVNTNRLGTAKVKKKKKKKIKEQLFD